MESQIVEWTDETLTLQSLLAAFASLEYASMSDAIWTKKHNSSHDQCAQRRGYLQ